MRKRTLCAALLLSVLLSIPAGAAELDPETASPAESAESSALFSENSAVDLTVPPPAAAITTINGVNVSQSTSRVAVDGILVAPEGYCINQENYYKLRDLAFLLTGKGTAFDVVWDDKNECISMVSGRNYTVAGGEMASSGSADIYKFVPSYSELRYNGEKVQLTGYNINNNNYYRIRDVGPLVGFGVDWDKDTYTVIIDSKTETTETPEEPAEPSEDSSAVDPIFGLPMDSSDTQNPEESNTANPDEEEEVFPWIGPRIDGTLTILLDPGHGGTDPGGLNATTKQDENHTNLAVALHLRDMLEAEGVRVIMVREDLTTTLRGADRKEFFRKVCETEGIDLLFSIHHNSAVPKSANGTEVWVQRAGLSPLAGQDGNTDPCHISQALGKQLLAAYNKNFPQLTNRGLKESEGKYMVNTPGDYGIPAVLSEFCFLSNDRDVTFIDEDSEQLAEAQTMFQVIMDFYRTTAY